jgi:hypothetical protein
MGAERVDLDRYADDFRYHLEHAEPGSALKECAHWGLNLVTRLRVAREVVDAARRVSTAVDVIGGSEEAARRLFALDQAVRAYDQHDPPATHTLAGGGS